MENEQLIKPKRIYKRIPCIKCISLPMCISIYKEHEKKEMLTFKITSLTYIMILTKKCSLVDDYTLEEKAGVFINQVFKYRSFDRVKKIYTYFRKEVYGYEK